MAQPGISQHGLLGSRGCWELPLGVTQAVPLQWAARALLLLAASLLMAWLGALGWQAWTGQGSWLEACLALAISLPWGLMSVRLWRGLAHSATLPVRWGGLPPARPARHPAAGLRAGWSLPGWPHAVALHVVFDPGPWVLVKMTSVADGARLQAWFWVDARLGFQGVAGHHLRALLFSTRANEVQAEPASPEGERRMVASSRDTQRQWSNLLSSFKTIDRHARKGAPSVIGTDFADTVHLRPLGDRS